MSLPRSIDRTDLAGATVTLTTTAETLALAGPSLQTPKDTSFVITLVSVSMTVGTGTTGITARVRSGAALTGAVVGQPFSTTGFSAGGSGGFFFMVTQQTQATDYVQNSVTVQQTGATGNGTINACSILMISF